MIFDMVTVHWYLYIIVSPAQRVQDILRQSDARDERKHERLCQSVTQTITANVNSQLDKLVRNTLVPSKAHSYIWSYLKLI